MTNDVDWDGPVRWDFPLALVLTATVVLTFARILRIGVGMRDELAGTV